MSPSKPKIDNAPGLVWRRRKNGWEARWQARSDLVKRGFTPKSTALWTGAEPTASAVLGIQAACQNHQVDMLAWAEARRPKKDPNGPKWTRRTTPSNPGDSNLMKFVCDHLSYDRDYCLIWPFARCRTGYGHLGIDGKTIYAHRYICELVHGKPPTPRHIAAHSCNRGDQGCVNPKHLSWKTPSENQLERGRRGYQYRLTPEQVAEIRRLTGLERSIDTAARFNVSEANIRLIQSGRSWKNEHPGHKVFSDDEIRAIRSSSKTDKELAADYDVKWDVIWRIRQRKTYRAVSAA